MDYFESLHTDLAADVKCYGYQQYKVEAKYPYPYPNRTIGRYKWNQHLGKCVWQIPVSQQHPYMQDDKANCQQGNELVEIKGSGARQHPVK